MRTHEHQLHGLLRGQRIQQGGRHGQVQHAGLVHQHGCRHKRCAGGRGGRAGGSGALGGRLRREQRIGRIVQEGAIQVAALLLDKNSAR
jgi:hypothetical protein